MFVFCTKPVSRCELWSKYFKHRILVITKRGTEKGKGKEKDINLSFESHLAFVLGKSILFHFDSFLLVNYKRTYLQSYQATSFGPGIETSRIWHNIEQRHEALVVKGILGQLRKEWSWKRQRECNQKVSRKGRCWFFASVQSLTEVTPRWVPACSNYFSVPYLKLSSRGAPSRDMTSSQRAPRPPFWFISRNKPDHFFCL